MPNKTASKTSTTSASKTSASKTSTVKIKTEETKINDLHKVEPHSSSDGPETVMYTENKTDSVEKNPMNQLMEMMSQMQAQLNSMSNELAFTKSELASTKEELVKAKEIIDTTEVKQGQGILNDNASVINQDNFTQLVGSTGSPYPVQGVNLSTTDSLDYNYTNIPQPIMATPSKADQYLEMLANRKSDREITIVHNREVLGRGTTHIKLSNLELDFTRLGETRTVTYMQAEELVSKYRGFFNREIILIADKDRDIAEKLQVPCVKRADGATLTRSDLNKLPSMSIEGLTKLYNSLSENDKKFMLSYWLGQCYTRTPGFYERYKIETLNSLSKNGTFDALLAFMNGEALNAGRNTDTQVKPNNQLNNLIDKHM